ncbi:MAG TPA: hypothetical protein VHB25_18140 [Gemmatimonadaceae bacterium]|nr:hypothetical protein [Gemmatimonadaceae bacterium]
MTARSALAAAVAVIGALRAAPAAAQPGGPYAPLVLSMPAGARVLALGNVGVAGRDDDVIFYNPAQVAVARGTSASYERYSATSSGGTVSSVTRLANSAIAIGASVVEYRTRTSVLANEVSSIPFAMFPLDRGESLGSGGGDGVSAELTAGYARTLKGVRVGAAVKYAEDEVPAVRMQRAAFDVGVARDFGRDYALALAVQNIGPSASISCVIHSETGHENCAVPAEPYTGPGLRVPVNLPLRATLGGSFAHEVGPFDLLSTAGVSMLRTNVAIPAAGAELGYSWLDGYDVDLRAGLRRPLAGEDAFTAGAGFTADRVSIDYALETFTGGRVGHRIGLRIR